MSTDVVTENPAVDISTKPVMDEFVLIDGTRFDYAAHRSWGLRDQKKYNRNVNRMMELEKLENPTEAQDKEHVKIVNVLVRMLLPTMTQSVFRKLEPADKGHIITGFFGCIVATKVRQLKTGVGESAIRSATRLQRFFGGPGLDYWLDLPPKILLIVVEQMKALKAEDTLQLFRAFALGSGNLEKEFQSSAIAQLVREATGEDEDDQDHSMEYIEQSLDTMRVGVIYEKVPDGRPD